MVMCKDFQPRDYQRAVIEHIVEHERCNVWAGMGTGKTASTLTALDALALVDDPFPALVLAPLRVASSTWPDEIRKWAHLHHLHHEVAAGGVGPMREALRHKGADLVTLNYDNAAALVEHCGERWPFKTVIADESTRLKSFRLRQGGVRAQALGKVAHKQVRRWVNLTGTPAPNGLRDLWGQAWFLDAGQRLGRTFNAFENRWFQAKQVGSSRFARQLVPLAHAQAEIEERLRDLTITVRAGDFLDLPPLVENVIEVELPPTARRHYRELEREMFTVLAGGTEVEAFSAAAKTMKCLQAANGALYVDDQGTWKELHDAKIDALASVVEEAAGTPVLVAYHFKSDLARLQRAFPQARTLDADPGTIQAWNLGRIPLLLAHPASAGHGLNLQDGGNIIVFFGLNWNLEEHEQIIERIGPTRQAQAGHNRAVYVHRIVARDTVDELVLLRLQSKASVQSVLLEAMKGKR
jgi:SNF2 family DNA or RNA helicase